MTTSFAVCPWCRTSKHVRPSDNPHGFYCSQCGREFEDVDDGVVGYGNPERFAIRNEVHSQHKQARKHSRREARQ
jgi:hypothetical protein